MYRTSDTACWTEAMIASLTRGRLRLLETMADRMPRIMDLLVQMRVFSRTDHENIMNNTSLDTPTKRARRLLDNIPKRPAKDYWNLILTLYHEHTALGHMAEEILGFFEEEGGVISNLDVEIARRDYRENQSSVVSRQQQQPSPSTQQQQPSPSTQQQQPSPSTQQQQPSPSTQQQQQQPSAPEQHDGQKLLFSTPVQVHDDQPPPEFQPHTEFSEGAFHQRARPSPQYGRLLEDNQTRTSHPESQATGGERPHEPMETDAEERGQTQGNGGARPKVRNSGDASSRSLPASTYQTQRQENPKKVYRMESIPRGVIMIFNQEKFDHIGHRAGTQKDCGELCKLFEQDLGFQVIVCQNFTGKEMDNGLVWFAEYLQKKEVDSCAVAFLTHGCKEECLLGRDAKFVTTDTGVEQLQPGTYIKAGRLREVFSNTRCAAMQGKPKLFILQACRGNLEDTSRGQIPFGRDMPVAEGATPYPRSPDQADMVFLNATVENYIAYRNTFIPHLVNVFRQYAATKHLLDLGTELKGSMPQQQMEGDILTISETTERLRKTFYLNPPNESTSRYQVITVSSYSALQKLK